MVRRQVPSSRNGSVYALPRQISSMVPVPICAIPSTLEKPKRDCIRG